MSEEERLPSARIAVERTVAEVDLACSRFREDSELTALNRAEGLTMRVSPLLLEAVAAAVRAAVITEGDVDPTLGGALIALGYDRDFAVGVADRNRNADGTGLRLTFGSIPGWRTIRLDHRAGTIGLARGVSLDLGATAKALAADRAAAAASQAIRGAGVLVGLGGDIATAGPTPDSGWWVRVTDDHRAGVQAPGQWITIRAGGLATSSTAARRWRCDGEIVHHLLDPVSKRPVKDGWRTVSVTAASCLDANIAATAAIVRGARAPAWLDSLGLPSRLVCEAGIALHVAGWPARGDDLAPVAEEAAE
ncbi:MAG: FAD:protein FMN transferase [Solirubrobacteraceae bacterium]